MPQKSRPAHPAAPTCSLCAAAQRERFALTHLAAETRARDAGIVFLGAGGGVPGGPLPFLFCLLPQINCQEKMNGPALAHSQLRVGRGVAFLWPLLLPPPAPRVSGACRRPVPACAMASLRALSAGAGDAPLRARVARTDLVVEAAGAARFAVRDPASGAELGCVPDMGADESAAAIDAATAAFGAWRAVPAKDKGAALRRWHDLIIANTDDLALIMTSECGKPLAEARGEVAYAASFVDFFAEEARRIEGSILTPPGSTKRVLVMKQAVGPAAMITPWNFPAAMITRKAAPAIAAGCPVVALPAPATPFTALALAKLAQEAGFPAGLFNVITSSSALTPEVGRLLSGHAGIKKLSFTGSTPVGKLLMSQAASTVKRVSLELGGNAPFIICDDADLDAAAAGLMASKFRNAGQTCVCANRVLVHESIYEPFIAKLLPLVKALKVGHGLEPGVTIGPLINAAAVDKVQQQVDDATERGARVLVGGKRLDLLAGNFFEPTVLAGVTNKMLCMEQETFGPLVPLVSFSSDADALRLANDTPAGLAAYIYARDLGRAWRLAEGLEYGMVGVNEGIISSDIAPFGGMKESGLGREGSKWGLDEYLETKYVCLGLGNPLDGLPPMP